CPGRAGGAGTCSRERVGMEFFSPGPLAIVAAYRCQQAPLNAIQLPPSHRMGTLAPPMDSKAEFKHALQLSPRRHSSAATTLPGLVEEQLRHFGVDPDSEGGRALGRLVQQLAAANCAAHELWELTVRTL